MGASGYMLKRIAKTVMVAGLAVVTSAPHAQAQGTFLDAAQIRPILNATKGQWVAVRKYNGRDLLYFTHLLAWRCGLDGISYAVNDSDDFKPWDIGVCDETAASPAAIAQDQAIYTSLPLGSITSVSVRITYDDEATDTVRYDRKTIEIP